MNEIKNIYNVLFESFGPQHWWPGETKFEIVVGAVLTQNTSWKNVEKSIKELKDNNLLEFEKILNVDENVLMEKIRSSGFYKQKAQRLKNLVMKIKEKYGTFENFLENGEREFLLDIKGIGMETADSILLYAMDKPYFVVDAYTLRIFKRYGIIDNDDKKNYENVRRMVEETFNKNVKDLQEFHALLVKLGKEYCRKNPRCDNCPLKEKCKKKI